MWGIEAGSCVVANENQKHQSSFIPSFHPLPPLTGKCHALLDWAGNNVGAAGAEWLAQELERNFVLTSFKLASTCMQL